MKHLILFLLFLSPRAFTYELNDNHFHLTNYVQEGTDIKDFLKIMGDKVGRVALFGIPLQQQWNYQISGANAPKYYLDTDAHLYYYSFTDAFIAMAYKSLSAEEQKRFDPMITGFNPTDMYATDHIKRVLKTFPGVFTGIGEFTIHKEFVSSKIAGDVASLNDKALDRIMDFAAEAGLVVLLHSDSHAPFPKPNAKPVYLDQMKALFTRHPKTTIIWAHTGLGRIVDPFQQHAKTIESIMKERKFQNVYFDISWNEVAKYLVSSPEALKKSAEIINKYPDRFLFGTDEVAPASQKDYLRVYEQYAPLFDRLNESTKNKLLKENYEKLFDTARTKVRKWEKENL